MKKVTCDQLVAGKSYYANKNRSEPVTFVKIDDRGMPLFTRPKDGKWAQNKDGFVEFYRETSFYEIEQPLTLQQKFEQGWSIEYKHAKGAMVIEMRTHQNGKIAVFYSDGDAESWDENEFKDCHTITPPAPKVERRFTSINCKNEGMVVAGRDFNTLEQAKENIFPEATCILEHEKQGDKWVFVKAHTL